MSSQFLKVLKAIALLKFDIEIGVSFWCSSVIAPEDNPHSHAHPVIIRAGQATTIRRWPPEIKRLAKPINTPKMTPTQTF